MRTLLQTDKALSERRRRTGTHVGKPTDMPFGTYDRVWAAAAKHGCTLWAAVAILLDQCAETCDTKHQPKGPKHD